MQTVNSFKIKKNSIFLLLVTIPKSFLLLELNQIMNKKLQRLNKKRKKGFQNTLFHSIKFGSQINHISFSPANNCFAICSDYLIRMLKLSPVYKKSFDIAFNMDYNNISYIKSIYFRTCWNFFTFTSNKNTVRFFYLVKYNENKNIGIDLAYIIESDHLKLISDLAFSPKNWYFASGSRKKTVKLYEIKLESEYRNITNTILFILKLI